ncbi:hypothetical protein Pcinc_019014 [Petrolisthes cinctipes]|uniref:Uncharacterized protein n=1 Tax=Petrolisthes cinctipes TaxID=88211 RepID=A0AAE1FL30_PETCI|nr:hypothetical protein Pcinc_019014 [Petrolisthes cinctipes]
MSISEDGQETLLSLAVKTSIRLIRELVCCYVVLGHNKEHAAYLREFLESVPPNCHATFLEQLSPVFDSVTSQCSESSTLDFIDDLALILLSSSVTHLDVDRFKYPTRNPTRYLEALANTRNLRGLISSRENVWKSDKSCFKLFLTAVLQMPMLCHLTLRHVRLPSTLINKLLEGLAANSPHLVHLDLKYVTLTDSGLDPDSLKKFGSAEDFVDCIPALLKMKGLHHLNVSETWLTYTGIREIVKNMELKSLEAIMDGGYDLQAAVIKTLVKGYPEECVHTLPRTTYTLVPHEPAISAICAACPHLEHITLLHLLVQEVKPTFLALAALGHLRRVTLCGLEWLLFHQHISLSDDPMPVSPHVAEVNLVEPSCVDACHLGALSICFPNLTHLGVVRPKHGGPGELWDRGRVFSNLTHLHYHGPLPTSLSCRFQRQQGLQTVLDVLLGWSTDLRALTLYTDFIKEDMLGYALSKNELNHLEELRLGQHKELSIEVITELLRGTLNLKIIGRTDWWNMAPHSKAELIQKLRERYKNLIVFGLDEWSDMKHDPHHNHEGIPDYPNSILPFDEHLIIV